MNTKLMFSSESNEWATPQELFEELDNEFHFTLDSCATKANAKCKKFYTKEDDGLSKSWDNEVVFVNPPYGREIGKWVKKASETSNSVIVMLIPARTDTSYFHDYIYKKFFTEIRFLRGRVKFVSNKKNNNSAPFPSMIVIFRHKEKNDKINYYRY